MTLVEKIRTLANQRNMSLPQLEIELGLGNGTISRWRTSSPNTDKLRKIADYFDVSMDDLLGRTVTLTSKDEKDIAKRLEQTLADLEQGQDGLMFSGEPLDEATKELLKVSLENSIRIAKINAKEKFTPKKYRK
ncbi:helix-turn-helix domain-containing protein [Ihubacter sp. rT4E-8]|uniref:helix-turn-helix domain-containing protein n=1 Tax=Ihubacter sp. rT4E-8 TaxID=3242369 RepID=UPI003CFB5F12